MKILLLGNIQSKWIKESIENVFLPLGHSVEVLGDEKNCKYADFYRDNGIVIRKLADASSLVCRMPFIRIVSIANRTFKANKWDNYDLIINMFVNYRDLMITSKLRTKDTKTVMFFAGSELLRRKKTAVRLYNVLLPHADFYIMGSQTLLLDFNRKFGEKFHGEVISFGISAFDNIDRLLERGIVKKAGNAFCIGYNGVKEQQHLAVLDVFAKLPNELKKKVMLIVPMTYLAKKDYIEEVKIKLDQTGIAYRQYTEYRDDDQMAELWCGVDYFIIAQTTDSLSASVLEGAYAGCELILPNWLGYPEHREMGIKKTEYRDFDELYSIIVDILEGRYQPSGKSNRHTLYDGMSWDSSRRKWDKLLDPIQKGK